MSRNSFARTVARAAASGGSKSYRSRRPIGWYSLMTLVVVLGVFLIVYSRNEKNQSTTAAAQAQAPGATDHWETALAFDLCGAMQPNLAASTNLTTVGLRTYGNGLIDIEPGVVANSASYEGQNDNLGVFALGYSGLTITDTSVTYPGKLPLANGAQCNGPLHGKGTLVAETWSSPTATPVRVTKNITSLHLNNDAMITIAFVPAGAKIPEPPSKATLITTVAQNAAAGPVATTLPTTTLVPVTPTTALSATTTTIATSVTTTIPASATTSSTASGTTTTNGVPSVGAVTSTTLKG